MGSRGKKKRATPDEQITSRLRGPVPSPIHSAVWQKGTERGVIIGGTKYGQPDGTEGYCLDLVDLDGDLQDPRRIALPFLAHGFSLDPRNVAKAVIFEKWGPGGAAIDLDQRSIERRIDPKPGHHFYGHGCFAPEASAVFVVETNLDGHEGVITIRDPDDFTLIDQFPSFGFKPHDCMLIDGGRTLAITNGRAQKQKGGSVTFVSIEDRKLLDERPVSSPSLNAGHLAMTDAGEFAVVSAARDGLDGITDLGGVSLSAQGPKLTTMAHPKPLVDRLRGEALSVCIHSESGKVVATHPYSHLVTIWDLKQKRFVKEIEVPSPRGVALSLCRKTFVVSCQEQSGLAELDVETLEFRPVASARVCSGSHLYNWARRGSASVGAA